MISIREVNDSEEKRKISASILGKLPHWFGITESTEEYVRESSEMTFFAGENIGFIKS